MARKELGYEDFMCDLKWQTVMTSFARTRLVNNDLEP
jgi:hypothetical protein